MRQIIDKNTQLTDLIALKPEHLKLIHHFACQFLRFKIIKYVFGNFNSY